MKKVLSLSLMALALIAFAGTAVSACGTCDAHKTDAKKISADKASCSPKTDATNASATAGKSCSASKTDATNASVIAGKSCSSSKTNAIKASASATCSKSDMAACAAQMGVSVEELSKMCGEKGSMAMQTISIKGMTCGNCENSVTAAIEAVPGVNKVVSISHKDASAVVCVNKSNTCMNSLTKAISDKGFQAEIIPAVATTGSAAGKACPSSCSTADKAACEAKKTEKKAEDTK